MDPWDGPKDGGVADLADDVGELDVGDADEGEAAKAVAKGFLLSVRADTLGKAKLTISMRRPISHRAKVMSKPATLSLPAATDMMVASACSQRQA